MRPDDFPRAVLERAYDSLVGARGAPGKMTRDGWVWALAPKVRGWTEVEFETAVRSAAGACRYFPSPKDIADHRPTPERTATSEGEWDPDRCPQCRSGYYAAGFLCVDGVVRERMRCACPHPSQRWCQMPMEEAA